MILCKRKSQKSLGGEKKTVACMEGIEAHPVPDASSIVSVFPQLVPDDGSFTSYSGFIEVKGEYFKLAISDNKKSTSSELTSITSKSISGTTVYGCSKLHALLAGSEELVQRRLTQSSSIAAFCLEFKHLIEQLLLRMQALSTASSTSKFPQASYYTKLLAEINSLGWVYVTSLNNELNRISFRVLDSHSREHSLELVLPPDYPQSSPTCNYQLPGKFEPKWSGRSSSISDLYYQFQTQLEQYQDIWRVLDDIDLHTCVVEPIHPLRSDLTRRIMISKLISLRIEFSIHNPLGVPVYSFMGAESAVSPFREKMSSRIHEWDYRKTPRQNFELLASIEFPAPSNTESQMQISEGANEMEACAICYGYKIDDSIPDQFCDNSSCNRAYHAKCLFDWFQSIQPAHRATLTLIWGNCPYCEKKISIRNPHIK